MSLDAGIQRIADDAGRDHLVIVVTLPDDAHGTAFVRAAEEIELSLENTSCVIIDMADVEPGEPPPPLGDQPGAKRQYLVGVVRGPMRSQVPDGDREAVKTNFFGIVVGILADHGLTEDPPEVSN